VAFALPIDPFTGGRGPIIPGPAELAAEAEHQLEAGALLLAPTPGATLTSANHRVWWGARIVAVGEFMVTVAHEGGLTAMPVESVAPADLMRAQEEQAAALAQRRRWEEAVARREAEQARAAAQAAQQAIEAALAVEATAERSAAGAAGDDPLLKPGPVQRLAALKKKFPLKTKGRTDRGIEFDVPSAEVWSFYRRTFEAATVETLPETLAYMESRRTQNLEIWQWRAKSTAGLSQSREHLQAAGTQAWLERTLRNFIADARLVGRER
jgi:hypothetical protein